MTGQQTTHTVRARVVQRDEVEEKSSGQLRQANPPVSAFEQAEQERAQGIHAQLERDREAVQKLMRQERASRRR
jgi:hypothetical protein